MSTKPENNFIRSIHKHLPSDIYHVKMNNPYTAGIPDVWYSGKRADVWIEYKWLPTVPLEVLPALTALQRDWLDCRHAEGRSVAVIVGCSEGGVWYTNRGWYNPLSREAFMKRVRSREELAGLIELWCSSGRRAYESQGAA